MPVVSAPTTPKGLPTANTNSPTRKLSELPILAAVKSLSLTLIAAKSRTGSLAVIAASNTRPSHNSTVVEKPRTTWAFVIIIPSECQITPAPTPSFPERT